MKPTWIIFVFPAFAAATLIAGLEEREVSALQGLEKTGRPVVLILTDDHRYDAMGFMGHPFLKTPQLDSIAKSGVHLKNAFVTTALCSPSRASILTGCYTHKHRVIDNNRPVPAGTVFFPQLLQRAGYRTGFFGKWHMGSESDMPQPGFDRWVSFKGQGTYMPSANGLNVDGRPVPQRGYITDELTDYAIDWLKQQPKGQPFFLYLSHKAVHAQFVPAPRHAGLYKDAPVTPPATQAPTPANLAGKPRWVRDQRNSWHGVDFAFHTVLDSAQFYRQYCETFLAVDESIGRVLQQLKDMGVYEETLVIYMGDNGFMFGEHGLIDKRVAYEESMRVPMLMQCPRLFTGGTVVNEMTANIDVAPTVLEVAGVQKPAYMDGDSLVGLAQGKSVPWRDQLLYVYYWEKNFPQTPTQFALRSDTHKYITYYGLWDTDELYDIANDPGETTNLIDRPEQRQRVQQMEDRLYEALGDKNELNIPINQPARGSCRLRLRARGGEKAADFPGSVVVDAPPPARK